MMTGSYSMTITLDIFIIIATIRTLAEAMAWGLFRYAEHERYNAPMQINNPDKTQGDSLNSG